MPKKLAFGGTMISFAGQTAVTLADVFGPKPIGPGEMVKKLWTHINAHDLKVKKAPK